jgi:hypothetical protein
MNRVVTSLFVFAFFGFALSSGISAVATAVDNVQVAFGEHHPAHHSLLSYERRL